MKITNTDLTGLIVQDQYVYLETFTGPDGSEPNSADWTVVSGSPTIQNNQLEFNVTTTIHIEWVRVPHAIVRNFDFRVHWAVASGTATNSWSIWTLVEVDDNNWVKIERAYDNDIQMIRVTAMENGSSRSYYDVVSADVTEGIFRITRNSLGETEVYYDIGVGYVQVEDTNFYIGIDDPITVHLGLTNSGGYPDQTGYFDNVTVINGSMVYYEPPPPPPAPSWVAKFGLSYWVCQANCSWYGDSYNEAGPGITIITTGTWDEGYRPTKIRVTGTGFSSWGSLYLRDNIGGGNAIATASRVEGTTEATIDWGNGIDMARLDSPYASTTNIEFLE